MSSIEEPTKHRKKYAPYEDIGEGYVWHILPRELSVWAYIERDFRDSYTYYLSKGFYTGLDSSRKRTEV